MLVLFIIIPGGISHFSRLYSHRDEWTGKTIVIMSKQLANQKSYAFHQSFHSRSLFLLSIFCIFFLCYLLCNVLLPDTLGRLSEIWIKSTFRFQCVCFVWIANVYAFLVVFVFPLNSAVNPLLYTFTTPKYRNQVLLRGWNKLTSRKTTRTIDGSGGTGDGSGGTGSNNSNQGETFALVIASQYYLISMFIDITLGRSLQSNISRSRRAPNSDEQCS